MPELPDVVVYCEALAERVGGQTLARVKLVSPFVLRTAVPPISAAEGKRVRAVSRLGKRIVLAQDDDLFLETLELTLEVVDLALVLGQTPVVLGSHAITSWGSEIAWRRTLHRGLSAASAHSMTSA